MKGAPSVQSIGDMWLLAYNGFHCGYSFEDLSQIDTHMERMPCIARLTDRLDRIYTIGTS